MDLIVVVVVFINELHEYELFRFVWQLDVFGSSRPRLWSLVCEASRSVAMRRMVGG